jgi:hypothetical protein
MSRVDPFPCATFLLEIQAAAVHGGTSTLNRVSLHLAALSFCIPWNLYNL